MSLTGIAASSIFQFLNPSTTQSNAQNFQKEFQQLGQDLSSGNLSQAQADFQALQPSVQPASSTTNTQTSSSSLSSAFTQLGQALSSGNLSTAQQDYSTVQQDLQQSSAVSGARFHHHYHGASSSQNSSQNPIDQLFSNLAQALQSNNLTAAQTAYSSLQQEFQALGTATPATSSSATPSVNVSA
jgi:outer membrane protein assembly factor BamD (BamD/ComL family)